MTTFNVEVLLKGRDYAVTEAVGVPHGAASSWNEAAVYDVLVETLRAIDRAQNPKAPRDRAVVLTGFSWIVEPSGEGQVILAIEIPMGAAAAGPFDVSQAVLDRLITNVVRTEREKASPSVVH
jgi:hypothetical protein